MKKKVCKSCKLFYDGSECPNCKSSTVATSWQGRLAILDKDKSEIAKKIGIQKEGEYAIKVR
ncbi:DNA-directed RNA polymerase subunit E'' [Candidatus Woesearchaeota archaeon]|nr:DNA-directed RNA polymerase subunit E'' [Candidatus Woesearchaeota archaeon]